MPSACLTNESVSDRLVDVRQTPLSQLLELKLDGSLRDHIHKARAASKDWRAIAAELTEVTGVQVSYETLRSWFADELEQPVEVAS